MEGRKPGRSGGWLECCLSEPRKVVHPGPDSSDGCASGTDQQSKGEHLLAAAQNSTPRNGDASSSTELVGIPAGATGWSLVGRVDGCCRLKISTCVLAEVLRCILVNDTCDTRGDTHGEMDRWRHWCANQRTSRGSVVVGRAGGGGARPSEPEAVLVWAATATCE